jgi:hypothetical protein
MYTVKAANFEILTCVVSEGLCLTESFCRGMQGHSDECDENSATKKKMVYMYFDGFVVHHENAIE